MPSWILRRRWLAGLMVAAIAVVASITTGSNWFAQDDIPLVIEDARVANPDQWPRYLDETYWPAPHPRDLYRPLTSLLLGVQWWLGGGAETTFKILQITLYAASCIAVFALALRLLLPWPALAVGLLFAAHPVHVEAVALAVNQAEVLVGLLAAVSVAWYVGLRKSGELRPKQHAILAAVSLVAANFKESGVMIPVLLFSAEWLVVRAARRAHLRAATSLIVWQTLAMVVVFAIRSRIDFENAHGTFASEAFEGQPMGMRLLTMLRVVPEWFRLLLWPSTLSADYSPGRIVAATGWSVDQTLGLALICLTLALAWRLRARAPIVVFGLAWCVAALFPVSNVIIPTGIALAERTLFMPSIGAMIVIGALLTEAVRTGSPALALRRGISCLVVLVVILGASRSMSRHRTWRNNNTMWAQAVIDNPDGYRPRLALGSLVDRAGARDRAVRIYEEALLIWDRTPGPPWQLAEWYVSMDRCDLATPLYAHMLTMTEFAPARSSLIRCRVRLGQYREARQDALDGIGHGLFVSIFRIWYRAVDLAIKQNQPPEMVRFDPMLIGTDSTISIQMPSTPPW